MQVITQAGASAPRIAGSVVSIGMFDGVHRGHRRVLRELAERGRALALPTVVVTFDPHPRAVLRPDAAPALLSTLDDRLALLAATGCVDHCLVLPFDGARSRELAEQFVAGLLVAQLGMRALVVGANFACGRGRAGDIALLAQLGRLHGYATHPVALHGGGESDCLPPCSSTRTRQLIHAGELAQAAAMLDRPHELTGVAGAGPELRLAAGMCVPPDGDYAGVVRPGHGATPWRSALLRVRGDAGGCRVGVHAARMPRAEAGTQWRVRFIERAVPGRGAHP